MYVFALVGLVIVNNFFCQSLTTRQDFFAYLYLEKERFRINLMLVLYKKLILVYIRMKKFILPVVVDNLFYSKTSDYLT